MTDNTVSAVMKYLYDLNHPDPSKIDSLHNFSMARGKWAKRVIDKNRTSQNYYKTKEVQTPLLDHYENVDWWERDQSGDFIPKPSS